MPDQGRPEFGVDHNIWDSSRIPRTYSRILDSTEYLNVAGSWSSMPTPERIKGVEVPSDQCIVYLTYWARLLKTAPAAAGDYLNFLLSSYATSSPASVKSRFGTTGGGSLGFFEAINVFNGNAPTIAADLYTLADSDSGLGVSLSGAGDPDGTIDNVGKILASPVAIQLKKGIYDFEVQYTSTAGSNSMRILQRRMYVKVERYD